MRIHYGKAAVRFYRVDGRHRLFAGEVAIDASGDRLRPAWTEGDNAPIVATDSMKNFIHAMALEYDGESLEEFGAVVGRRFLATYPHIERIRLRAREVPFVREGTVLYSRARADYGAIDLVMGTDGILDHRCGREGLRLIKVTGSSFAGFVRDRYTTLPETHDRPLFVHLNVYWRHRSFDERVPSEQVRGLAAATFDEFPSRSIQHLVHEMGQRILARCPSIVEVSFEAENRTWDAACASPGEAGRTVYADPRPPYGVIGLVLKR